MKPTTTVEAPTHMRQWQCPKCKRVARMSLSPPLPIHCACGFVDTGLEHTKVVKFDEKTTKVYTHQAKPIPITCQFRGEELRRETCDGCKGKVQIKVFSCVLHGECTIAKALPGVHVCDGAAEASVHSSG